MINYSSSLQKSSGFTLIEGIVALGIISTTLIVGLSLAISNLTAAQDNSDRIIAGNLAREGLEIVRQNRDSNWVRRVTGASAPYDWYVNQMTDPAKPVLTYTFGYVDPHIIYPGGYLDWNSAKYFSLLAATPSLTPSAYDLASCMQANTDVNCQVKKFTSSASPSWELYYQYDSTINPGGAGTVQNTQFYRRMLLEPICMNGTTEYVSQISRTENPSSWLNCKSGGSQIGVSVTSQVMWKRGAKTLETSAKARLYGWLDGVYATSSGAFL